MPYAVQTEDLYVTYQGTHALDGIDLAVEAGTTLGVLGHNGAGKTTLVRVLTTLTRPTGGRASVDGFDVVHDAGLVRRRIGVTGQYAGLDEFLTAFENLVLVGRLAGLRGSAHGRAGELVDALELHAVADRRVGELSGGWRRRVDLAASLVGRPSVLFLDEPTTGLDPMARAALWDVVGGLADDGTTVALTTQYLEEADRLADDIVVLDHGRVAARGTPAELKRIVGGKIVTATIDARQADALTVHPDVEVTIDGAYARVARNVDAASDAAAFVADLARVGVDVHDLDVSSPSLDDVVAHLSTTGVPA
jgi:ABC-2 type transport system ATP-binding protein